MRSTMRSSRCRTASRQMVRIQDGTPPERLRRIIGRFSSNNHGCILFQRMFIDKDRENALSLAKSAYNREIGRPT